MCFFLALAATAFAASGRVTIHPKFRAAINGIGMHPDGVLYVTADSGLLRYEGRAFTAVPGYPYRDANDIAIAGGGWVWISSFEKGVVRYHPSSGFQTGLNPGIAGNLWAAGELTYLRDASARSLSRIDAAGSFQAIPLPDPCPEPFWQEFWLRCGNGSLHRFDPSSSELIPVHGFHPAKGQFLDSQGRFWSLYGHRAEAWVDGRRVLSIETDAAWSSTLPMFQGRNGQVWLCDSHSVRGLSPPMEFEIGAHAEITALHEDWQGHVWVADSAGALWELIPGAEWEQWSAASFRGKPVQVLRGSSGERIAVAGSSLYRLDEATRSWSTIAAVPKPFAYVLPLPQGGFIAALRDYGLARLSDSGRILERVPGSESEWLQDDFRKLVLAPDGTILAGNKKGFFAVSASGLRQVNLPGVWNGYGENSNGLPFVQAVDFEYDPAGTLWTGYSLGLAALGPGGAWRQRITAPPLRDLRSIAFAPNGDVWAAQRHDGFFWRLRGDAVTRFTGDNGYKPEKTWFLKIDRRGWIWRGSSDGVHLSNGVDLAPEDWLFLDAGGETAQYGYFEDRDGSIWISGSQAVLHLRPTAGWFADRPGGPVLTNIVVNKQRLDRLPDAWDQPLRHLQLEFSRLTAAPFRQDLIRYRLMPRFSDWRVAPDGRIAIDDLANGDYRLEVREKGSNETMQHAFRVGPASRLSPWWLLPPLLLAATLGYATRERLAYQFQKARYLIRRWRAGQMRNVETNDLTGRLLHGRYRVLHRIAGGGFARVYQALDEKTSSTVAVKVLNRRLGEEAWVRARFAQEMAALNLVRHPGVIPLLDSWVSPSGEPVLVMPLIAGYPLRAALTGEPWEPRRTGDLIAKLADSLAAVHAAGVVHRDLKPENIMLTADAEPVLIDFGTSGLLGAGEGSGHTKVLAGSMEYLAPERLLGHYSPASDTYSLGAIAFELLTGVKAAQSGIEVSTGKMKSAAHYGIPEGAVALLSAALDPLPERRPVDVRSWARELAESLG
ncbi:MAG: protein kinase [Bryobacteraceae bacterium]